MSHPGQFKPGQYVPGRGRPKGVPNKSTDDLRKFLRNFVEKNQNKMQSWLDKAAEKDPLGALRAMESLYEYCLPKLQRIELVGDPDQPLEVRSHEVTEAAAAAIANQTPEESVTGYESLIFGRDTMALGEGQTVQ